MAGGKTAVVTGAGTGVGRAVALTLLRSGWNTVLCGRRANLLDETLAARKPVLSYRDPETAQAAE